MAGKKKKPDLKSVKSENVIEFAPDDRELVIAFLKSQIKIVEENDISASKAMVIIGYDNDHTDDYTYSSYSMTLRDFLYSSELIKFNLLAENYND